ncbi:LicD family protein, partial [Neobacillus niacini]|uniref:LicD family protein n=1 Tax=Neobacillus niacini TaxID=86668 RepID=UPI002FFE4BB2
YKGLKGYKLLAHGITKNYPFPYAKVVNTQTIKIEKNIRDKYNWGFGVDIDVFPIDGMPNNTNAIKKIFQLSKKSEFLLKSATYKFGTGKTLASTISKNIGIMIFRFFELMGLTSVEKVLYSMAELNKDYNFNESELVAVTVVNIYGEKELVPRSIFDEELEVDFEDSKFIIPKGYDIYLRNHYGEYMQLPPIEKRVTHHVSRSYMK